MSKSFVVTGAATGIGLEAARQLRDAGFRVIATARDARRCAEIRQALGTDVETVEMEMTSLASIRAGAARIRELAPALDGLVNNAGVFEMKRRTGTDGHEMTWAVNTIAPYVLSEALAGALESAPTPRIVNVGSIIHTRATLDLADPEFERRKFSGVAAYGQSKLALNLVTLEFAKRHPRIMTNAVHPGGIATNIYRNTPGFVRAILMRVLPGPAQGAMPLVRVATDPALDGVTGRYFNKMNEAKPSAASLDGAAAARLYADLERVAGA